MGVKIEAKSINLTKGLPILNQNNQEIGELRSAAYSPKFKKIVGIAMVKKDFCDVDQKFKIKIKDTLASGKICNLPILQSMKKARIYIPAKTAMQSGRGKTKKWILEFITKNTSINPLMGWESSTDTLEEVVLRFSSKEKAIEYAELNDISYKVIEPKKREFVIKSYADNFLKN